MALRILSVGSDLSLLKARHQLLLAQGYEADYAYPEEAENRLLTKQFDLLILSATVPAQEKQRVRVAASFATPVIDLTTLVWPAELLELIKKDTLKIRL